MSEKQSRKKDKKPNPNEEKNQKKFQVQNKYDPYLLKNAMNEGIQHILEEKYLTRENHKHIDNKIIMGTLIGIVVLTSHYYPLEFPKNWWLLVGCISCYAVLAQLFTWYEKYVEKNEFYIFKFGNYPEDKMMNKFFCFASDIELYSDQYEIMFRSCENTKNFIARKVYVGDYFDVEGNLSLVNLEALIIGMLNEYKKKFI